MNGAKQPRHVSIVVLLCQAIEYAIAVGLVTMAPHLPAPGRTMLLVCAGVIAGVAALTRGPLGVAKLLGLGAHRLMLLLLPIGFVVGAVLGFRSGGVVPAGALVIAAAALFRLRGMTATNSIATAAAVADERRNVVPDETVRRAGNAVGKGLRAGEEHLHRGAYGLGRVVGRWRR